MLICFLGPFPWTQSLAASTPLALSAKDDFTKFLLVKTSSIEGRGNPKYVVVNKQDGTKALIKLDTKSNSNYASNDLGSKIL